MINQTEISKYIPWKDLISKIEPQEYILLLDENDEYILGWDVEDELILEGDYKFEEIDSFLQKHKGKHVFSYFSYDVKNKIEESLSSSNIKLDHFPDVHLFTTHNTLMATSKDSNYTGILQIDSLIRQLENSAKYHGTESKFELIPGTEKSKYVESVIDIKKHIQRGDIYEMNYCIPFYTKSTNFNHVESFYKLHELSKAPFSVLLNNKFGQILSASPERFIKKTGNKILSQPIKGTAARGKTAIEDLELKKRLQDDPKERAENIMIVDLVRNDLSKIALKNSVEVKELCEIYSFQTVHQMISSIECEVKEDKPFSDILKALFPMGSMTGAPKISAMKIAEQYEDFKRGIYSGAIGVFYPSGDFDFNVVIRTIVHDKKSSLLSAAVGSAITIKSNPENEFEECLVKLNALKKTLC